MDKGKRNAISDVSGVTVGHYTVDAGEQQTGVTVVMPCLQNPFIHQCRAASHVINGYGKTLGLVQVDELGTLETPIALTNTLNVGLVHDALVQYTLDRCKAEGLPVPRSVNPVVAECNDGRLNLIENRVIGYPEVTAAIRAASPAFAQGAVGAGRGTICYGGKGGIGSASRVFEINGECFTLGVLVQSNYGDAADLRITSKPLPITLSAEDRGSIILVLATDLPLTHRQLHRVIKRAAVGMARLGSFIGHGSGEIVIGFTTADPVLPDAPPIRTLRAMDERLLNIPFRAAGLCAEEAILASLLYAEAVTGREGLRVSPISISGL